MILNYAFDQKDSAYQLYQTAFSSLQQKETTNTLATHLAEQQLGLDWPELCDLVSVYPKAGKWMVQFWFDDEMGKVSDRIDQVITAFCQEQGLSFVEKTNSTLASEHGSDLHWPDTVSEPTYTPIADGEFYVLTFSLPSEDPQKIGIQLNTDQMVACIDYWQRRGKMKFTDMSMVVADLSADGDEVAQNLEHISDRLNQVGGVWTNAVNFSPFMRAASEQHNLITTLIHNAVTQHRGTPILCNEIVLELISANGISINFSTNRALQRDEQQSIQELIQASYLGVFIDRLFQDVLHTSPCCHWNKGRWYDDEDAWQEAAPAQALMSLTDLLKQFNVGLSAVKANKLLVSAGVLQEIKMRGVKTPKKIFSEDHLMFGRNLRKSHRKNDMEARYYPETFQYLVDTCLA